MSEQDQLNRALSAQQNELIFRAIIVPAVATRDHPMLPIATCGKRRCSRR